VRGLRQGEERHDEVERGLGEREPGAEEEAALVPDEAIPEELLGDGEGEGDP
jgi:hypothetical protein